MAVTREDIDILKEHFDDRYVQQNDCNDIQARNIKKFANDDKRIEAAETTLKGVKKIGWIAITALIGEVVLSFLSLLKGV